jgi:alpha-D-ribose 1-methylphosphonate 5-triphosphate synthase subunit PhnI
MRLQRRISSTFKDVPGGQVLGPTYDYTQRLLDFTLEAGRDPAPLAPSPEPLAPNMPRVTSLLEAESLVEADAIPPGDPPRRT